MADLMSLVWVSRSDSSLLPVSHHDAAPNRMDGGAKSYHLHSVDLWPATRALSVVSVTVVVLISKGVDFVVHCAEVVEETPQGFQAVQVVANLQPSSIICACCSASNEIKSSLPKCLVLEVDFEQSPGLALKNRRTR